MKIYLKINGAKLLCAGLSFNYSVELGMKHHKIVYHSDSFQINV